MSTTTYCAKQATAMAEYYSDFAKSKLDDAIDSEENRDELIAARTQELVLKRQTELSADDVQAGMHRVLEGGARLIAQALIADDLHTVGVYIRAVVHMYIERDSEEMANDWMLKIERELAQWGN